MGGSRGGWVRAPRDPKDPPPTQSNGPKPPPPNDVTGQPVLCFVLHSTTPGMAKATVAKAKVLNATCTMTAALFLGPAALSQVCRCRQAVPLSGPDPRSLWVHRVGSVRMRRGGGGAEGGGGPQGRVGYREARPVCHWGSEVFNVRAHEHEGQNLSQRGGRMLFSPVGCLGKKPCPKGCSWLRKFPGLLASCGGPLPRRHFHTQCAANQYWAVGGR